MEKGLAVRKLLAVGICCTFALGLGLGMAQASRYDLAEAVSQGLVTLDVSGSTRAGPGSVTAVVSNSRGAAVELEITPGTILKPHSSRFCRLVVRGVTGSVTAQGESAATETIALSGYEAKGFLLATYLLDFAGERPNTSTSFRLGPVDPTAKAVLEAAAKAELSETATQAALWLKVARATPEQIGAQLALSPGDLRAASELSTAAEPQAIALSAKPGEAVVSSPVGSTPEETPETEYGAGTPSAPVVVGYGEESWAEEGAGAAAEPEAVGRPAPAPAAVEDSVQRRPGSPRPSRRDRVDTAVDSTHAGWVIGRVYDAATGAPVEGAGVTIQESGTFAIEGRTVATTDYVGQYRNSTDLGRVSTSYNVAGLVLGRLFGPATKKTTRIDVTQLNIRVAKQGYRLFEGAVRCRETDPENFSVDMEPILLVRETGAEVSTVADGWGAVGILDVRVEPRVVHPGESARVVARLRGPLAATVREESGLFARHKKEKLHMSISSSVFAKRRSLSLGSTEEGSIVFSGEFSIPKSAKYPSQHVEALIETSPVEIVRGAESKRALFQIVPKGADQTAARLRLDAADLEDSGNSAEAVEKLKELCARADVTIDDQLRLARLSEQVHDYSTAATAMKTALGMMPPEARSVVIDGKELKRDEGRWQAMAGYTRALIEGGQASSVLSEVLPEVEKVKDRDRPGTVPAEVMVAIAAAHLALGDLDGAVAANEQLSRWERAVTTPRARAFHRDLRVAQAERATSEKPRSAQAWAEYGRALMDQGHWEEAVTKLQTALEIDGSSSAVRRDLTYALLHLRGTEAKIGENIDEALASAGDQVGISREKRSENADDWHTYATLLYRKAYQQYLANDDDGASRSLEQCRQALTETVRYGRAGADRQESTTVHYGEGFVLATSDRVIAISGFASAEINCDHQMLMSLDALGANPDDYLAWYSLAAALLDLEQTDVGEAALQECLWLRPDFPEAKYAQALVLVQKGDRARAMSQLREVIALNPRHPYANKTLAQLCAEEGDMVGSAACLSAHAQVYGTAQ